MDISLAEADMLLPSEAIPRGHEIYPWAHRPRVIMGLDPTDNSLPAWYTGPRHGTWPYIVAWFTVFHAAGGAEQWNTRVQIKNLKLYLKSKKDVWREVYTGDLPEGADFSETRDNRAALSQRKEPEGISLRPSWGWFSHGWSTRVEFDVNDLAGVYVELSHRLIPETIYAQETRLNDVWVVSVGADYYGDNIHPNLKTPGVAVGRQIRAFPDWRRALMAVT